MKTFISLTEALCGASNVGEVRKLLDSSMTSIHRFIQTWNAHDDLQSVAEIKDGSVNIKRTTFSSDDMYMMMAITAALRDGVGQIRRNPMYDSDMHSIETVGCRIRASRLSRTNAPQV